MCHNPVDAWMLCTHGGTPVLVVLLAGLELVLNSRVASVRPGYVKVFHKEGGQEEEIPFGACVWATGIAMNPLVKQLQQLFPDEQKHFRWVQRCSMSSARMLQWFHDATVHFTYRMWLE